MIRPLNFFGRTREDSIHFHGSPKKNPETVSKYEGHTSSAKLLSVSSGKAYSKQMCLYKPWKSKTLAFFDDKRSKSGPRNFFKDFGCIILFKTLTGLIRAINRTNSWLNQTCRGDKRCQWRKEDHDSSRDPPKKKNAHMLTKCLQSWSTLYELSNALSNTFLGFLERIILTSKDSSFYTWFLVK